jgi:hypothetical protein
VGLVSDFPEQLRIANEAAAPSPTTEAVPRADNRPAIIQWKGSVKAFSPGSNVSGVRVSNEGFAASSGDLVATFDCNGKKLNEYAPCNMWVIGGVQQSQCSGGPDPKKRNVSFAPVLHFI